MSAATTDARGITRDESGRILCNCRALGLTCGWCGRASRVTFIHNATLDGTQDDWRVAGRPEVYATEAEAVAAYRAARRATETEV